MKKTHSTLLILTLLFFFFTAPRGASAHKLYVFAYEEDGKIVCEATFSGGKAVQNSPVTITLPDHTLIAQGTTDKKGIYRVDIPETAKKNHADLTITVAPGDGHQGSWLLEANDYLASSEQKALPNSSENTISSSSDEGKATHQGTVEQQQCRIDDIRAVVAEELAPIKRTLAKEQLHTVTLPDILGGIGYILGLAGLAAYMKSQKKGDN